MRRFRSLRNSLAAFALFLIAGCFIPTGLSEEFAFTIIEATVWNDFMPGSPPRCHALLKATVTNKGDTPFVLYESELTGAIFTINGAELRSFAPQLHAGDGRQKAITLEPGKRQEVTFKTPMGIEPFDVKVHPKVILTIAFPARGTELAFIRTPLIEAKMTQ